MKSILFRIVRICRSLFKGYLKNEKIFLNFYSFLESSSNFKHFQKKYMVIANIFPKLETVKGLVRALSKKRCLRTCFESEHVKWPQTLVKSV